MAAPVEFEFTGDPKSAEAALASMERKYDNLEEKIKRMAATSKKGHVDALRYAREHSSGLENVATSSMQLIGSYVSVTAAVNLASLAHSKWRADIEKTASAATKANQALISELALAGDLMQGPKVRQRLESIPLATDEQAQAIYAGIRGARPTAPLDEVLAGVEASAPASLLFDDAQLKEFGAVFGKLQDFAPGRSAKSLANLTQSLRAMAGEDVGQLLSGGFERVVGLQGQKGFSLEESLAFIQQGITSGSDAGTLATISSKITGRGQLRELLQDPAAAEKALGKKGAAALALMDAGGMQDAVDQLMAGQANNQLALDVRQATLTDPFTIKARLNAAEAQDTLREEAKTERTYATLKETLLAGSDNMAFRGMVHAADWLSGFFDRPGSTDIKGANGETVDAERAVQTSVLKEISGTLHRMEQGQPGKQPPKVNRPAGAME